MNKILNTISIWSAAQTPKTAGRGISASNQQLSGIQKLRELILELAVRGKLVPQDPDDEPASELLKKIETEKKRLIKEEKIKKQEALPEVGEDEKPFDLPKGWGWTRLGNLCSDIHYGFTASANSEISKVRLLRITDIQNDKVNWETVPGCDIETFQIDNYRLEDGDILIARTGGTIGKSYLVENINLCSVFASYLIRLKKINESYPLFIKTFLGSLCYWNQLYENSMGTGQPNVNGNALKNLVFPLPPLSEQRRIVAKVDELMALCDELEQQQTNSNTAHETLVETFLSTLTNAGSPAAFDEAWQRIATHFDTLFTTEHSIDLLKQTILQLAVMGKLVPQNPGDEPASELLKKISKEKAQLVKEGKIKKQAALPEITDDEKPFELPSGWEWTRLGNLSADIHYGFTASANLHNKDIRLLRITDIQNDKVNWETVPGCEIETSQIDNYRLENGDILIARTGGTIGKSYLVGNIDLCSVFASYLIRIKRINESYSLFIKTYLGSQCYWNQLYANSMGTGQPNVNGNALKNLVFPLPPLPEQHRIVAKVEELFALCDTLKQNLSEAQTIQNQLAGMVVEGAIN